MLRYKLVRDNDPRRIEWPRYKEEMLRLQEENRLEEERHTNFSSPISPMFLTGDAVRDDVRVDRRTSPRDCNLFARFLFFMGARDHWSCNETFDEMCHELETHVFAVILPMCSPECVWLPDENGKGWRPDLGVQLPDCTTERRFAAWLTKVALRGKFSYKNWTLMDSVISLGGRTQFLAIISDRRTYNTERVTERHMVAFREERRKRQAVLRISTKRIEPAIIKLQRTWRRRMSQIMTSTLFVQRLWREHAYGRNGCMRKRDRAAFESDFGEWL